MTDNEDFMKIRIEKYRKKYQKQKLKLKYDKKIPKRNIGCSDIAKKSMCITVLYLIQIKTVCIQRKIQEKDIEVAV